MNNKAKITIGDETKIFEVTEPILNLYVERDRLAGNDLRGEDFNEAEYDDINGIVNGYLNQKIGELFNMDMTDMFLEGRTVNDEDKEEGIGIRIVVFAPDEADKRRAEIRQLMRDDNIVDIDIDGEEYTRQSRGLTMEDEMVIDLDMGDYSEIRTISEQLSKEELRNRLLQFPDELADGLDLANLLNVHNIIKHFEDHEGFVDVHSLAY